MIQRVQTIWLLLAAIAGFLITQIPLYLGTFAGDVIKKYTATESLLLFAVAIIGALLALVAIFLYKNRSNQIRLAILGIVVSIALIVLEVSQIDLFQQTPGILKATYYWGALLPVAMVIFFILAAINIRKDNKLVKSLDRLR
jgi:peptidoglycan/LPS O-acetylase OafA/YrhL